MTDDKPKQFSDGLIYAFIAFIWWGVVPPVFFTALKSVPVFEVLAHRIVWSCLLLGTILFLSGRLHLLKKCVLEKKNLAKLILTTLLIGVNWYVYVYGVEHEQVVQTSLGYFMNPLLNVVLGMLFFGESLSRLQWTAVMLAAIGVALLTVSAGEFPWIALSLATTFGIYGMIRKTVNVDGLVSLSFEILALGPISLAYILLVSYEGTASFAVGNWWIDFMLVISAAVTAIPLFCFGQATRRLPLTVLGFIQYLAPTLQFLTAIYILEEPIQLDKLICFSFIWFGLAVYTIDSVLQYRKTRRERLHLNEMAGQQTTPKPENVAVEIDSHS